MGKNKDNLVMYEDSDSFKTESFNFSDEDEKEKEEEPKTDAKPPPFQRKVTGWAGKKKATDFKAKKTAPVTTAKVEEKSEEEEKPGLCDPPSNTMYMQRSVTQINMQGSKQMTMEVICEASNESHGSSRLIEEEVAPEPAPKFTK